MIPASPNRNSKITPLRLKVYTLNVLGGLIILACLGSVSKNMRSETVLEDLAGMACSSSASLEQNKTKKSDHYQSLYPLSFVYLTQSIVSPYLTLQGENLIWTAGSAISSLLLARAQVSLAQNQACEIVLLVSGNSINYSNPYLISCMSSAQYTNN